MNGQDGLKDRYSAGKSVSIICPWIVLGLTSLKHEAGNTFWSMYEMKVHELQVIKEKLEEDIALLIEKFKKDTNHPFFNADIDIQHPHSIKDPHRVRVTIHI